MAKIGVFGGTFNPVHNGHINLLKTVMNSIEFDKVYVLPDRIPPHKQALDLLSGEDRLNMCRLAFDDIKKVEVSDWELKQIGKSYSVLTLRHLKGLFPNDRLYFIMGSDMLLSFHTWYQYEEILSLAAIVCISREDFVTDSQLENYADGLREKGGEIFVVKAKPFVVSSSEIRDKLKNHIDCSCYLDKNVVKYIEENKLYEG